MGSLHLTSIIDPAFAYHDIRDDVTAYWSGQSENIRARTDFHLGLAEIACSVVPLLETSDGDMHIVAIAGSPTGAGELLHTIRPNDGSWPFPMGDVQSQTSQHGPNIGPVTSAACAANEAGDLHVCTLDQNKRLWHTIRTADGNWPFAMGDVQEQTSQNGPNIGPIAELACAASLSGHLHLCLVDQSGNLWHTIRNPDGTWPFAMGNVQAQTSRHGGRVGPIANVSCATNQDGDLHVCITDQRGGLWHTIRSFNGEWPFPFGDVQQQTRLAGPDIGLPLDRVTCTTNLNDGLHVAVINTLQGSVTDGGLWHAIRGADGVWTAFENVKGLLNSNGSWLRASISHSGPPLG